MSNDYFNVSADCQIVTTRVMAAPRQKVYKAWTDGSLLQQWWGPAGFTNTFYEFNPVEGGKWRFTMHGPDKGNYENECTFICVQPPALLAWDRISQPLFRVVTTFEEAPGGDTTLTFRMQFTSKEACDKIRPFVVTKNEENFDKLETVLLRMG